MYLRRPPLVHRLAAGSRCCPAPPEAAAATRLRRCSGRGRFDPGRQRPRGPHRVKNRRRSDSDALLIQSGVGNQTDERTVITLIRMKIFIIKTNIHLNTKLPLYPWYQKITMKKKLPWVSKSNSNRLIFSFSFSHHIGKSLFSISTYMEELLQQIDFPPFYVEREMRCLLFLLVIGEKLLGIEKK